MLWVILLYCSLHRPKCLRRGAGQDLYNNSLSFRIRRVGQGEVLINNKHLNTWVLRITWHLCQIHRLGFKAWFQEHLQGIEKWEQHVRRLGISVGVCVWGGDSGSHECWRVCRFELNSSNFPIEFISQTEDEVRTKQLMGLLELFCELAWEKYPHFSRSLVMCALWVAAFIVPEYPSGSKDALKAP